MAGLPGAVGSSPSRVNEPAWRRAQARREVKQMNGVVNEEFRYVSDRAVGPSMGMTETRR